MKKTKSKSQVSAHLQKELMAIEKLYNLVWLSRKQLSEKGHILPEVYSALLSGLISEKAIFSALLL